LIASAMTANGLVMNQFDTNAPQEFHLLQLQQHVIETH
jgi:hypothetical protein